MSATSHLHALNKPPSRNRSSKVGFNNFGTTGTSGWLSLLVVVQLGTSQNSWPVARCTQEQNHKKHIDTKKCTKKKYKKTRIQEYRTYSYVFNKVDCHPSSLPQPNVRKVASHHKNLPNLCIIRLKTKWDVSVQPELWPSGPALGPQPAPSPSAVRLQVEKCGKDIPRHP